MTRSATISWPEPVLGCPLRAEYTGSVVPMFNRTTISPHAVAYRLARQDEVRTYSLSFLWSLGQLSAFQGWFNNNIAHGMRAFTMKQLTSGLMEPLYCMMTSAYSITPQPDHLDLVRVRFDVMAFWRVASPPDWTGGP